MSGRLGRCGVVVLIALTGLLARSGRVVAAEAKSLAELAPPGAVVYAQLDRPAELVDLALDPALQQALERIPQYAAFFESQQWRELRAVVTMLEAKLGTNWREAITSLTAGGVAAAFDAQNQAVVLLLRTGDAQRLAKLHATIEQLVEQDAANKGNPSPMRRQPYRDLEAVSFGPGEMHVILGDVLAVANKPDVLRGVVDRYLADTAEGLAATTPFRDTRAMIEGNPVGWAMVQVEPLRGLPPARQLLGLKADNPALPLFFGDLFENLRHSPAVTAALHVEGGRLALRIASPHDAQGVNPAVAGLFPTQAGDAAAPPLRPSGTVLSLSTYRDFGALWAARDALLQDQPAAQLAQADANLGQFFAGRDFGTQVLGELAAQIQIVVARQEFGGELPVPQIKLPAFAVVVRLKNPDTFSPVMLVAYQKIVGLVNLAGGNQGQPQLLLTTEMHQGVAISKAEYLAPEAADAPGRINYNFSPACARVGDHFIVSSTAGLARDLVDGLLAGEPDSKESLDHTLAELDIHALIDVLRDNREALVAQNMLQQGNNRAQAEALVDGLLAAGEYLKNASLRLGTEPGTMVLELEVELDR